MTGGLARLPLSPTGLRKRPTYRTEANKKLQKDISFNRPIGVLTPMTNNIFLAYSFR
jgi:hypothetical protein